VQVGGDQQRIAVGAMFGSVRVVVPDDVRVRSSGTVVFGSTNCDEACRAGPNLREVAVEADGAFGSINIMRQSEVDRAAATTERDRRDQESEDD
jgi:predicted membrane protein